MRTKNKKGVSVIIGYVILVAAAVSFGVIVYNWLVTYTPTEVRACPEDVSIFIKEYSCEFGSVNQLNLTTKNNGKFDIAGYFVYASNDSNNELASHDLSQYIEAGGIAAGNAIIFVAVNENPFKPNDEKVSIFNLTTSNLNTIKFLDITPVRFQEQDNKLEFVSCGGAKIKETITCTP